LPSSVHLERGLRIEVVDSTRDCGATGMRVDVFTLGAQARKLCGGVVNREGVVDAPVLSSEAVVAGEYEVVFHVGAYFGGRQKTSELPLLDTVPFRFALPYTRRFVLPVRVAPWAFALVRPESLPD
jgi:5-hydroxyisourate hydrolase